MTAAIDPRTRAAAIRAALGNCASLAAAAHNHAGPKPDKEVQANITLAMLRVKGQAPFLADPVLREMLETAAACLEYVHAALDARVKHLEKPAHQAELIAGSVSV